MGRQSTSQTQNDEAQAIAELERALDLGLRVPAAYFDLGLMNASRDRDKAARYLRDAVKHPDYALGASLLLAQINQESDNLAEAAADYMRALGLADAEIVSPQQADELRSIYEPLIDAQASETDHALLKSICDTIKSQLLRPDWRAYLHMARQNLPAQPADAAPIPVTEMLLESRSSLVVEAIGQVRRLAGENMVQTAMEEAYFAVQLAPTYLPVHIEIGELLLKEGRTDDAVKKFMAVADLYNVRGETDRAVRLMRRILEIAPMDQDVRTRLINLLIAQEKIDEALQEYMQLADTYYRLAELDKARQTYLTALKTAQQSRNNRTWGVDILLKVADIDMQRLNFRQALRIFEQIRTIQPDNADVRMQVIQLQFRLGQPAAVIAEVDAYVNVMESSGRRAKAIEFLNSLLTEVEANPDIRRRLADLYAREGRVAEAVAQLDAVADAYVERGKMLEAINILETILALKPANADEYRSALDELRKQSLRR